MFNKNIRKIYIIPVKLWGIKKQPIDFSIDCLVFLFLRDYIIPIPPPIGGIAGSSFLGSSVTAASVVNNIAATLAAF